MPTYGEHINVRAPRRTLSSLVAGLDAAYGRPIPADNPAPRLLTRYIGIAHESESLTASCDGRPSLISTTLWRFHRSDGGRGRDRPKPGVQAARLRAIKEEIATRFHQADLSVATIAARHQLKPRWVQCLFESEGHDLHRVCTRAAPRRRAPIADNPLYANQKVSTIALDTRFGDLSYFNGAFRRRYSITPSELRAAAKAPPDLRCQA